MPTRDVGALEHEYIHLSLDTSGPSQFAEVRSAWLCRRGLSLYNLLPPAYLPKPLVKFSTPTFVYINNVDLCLRNMHYRQDSSGKLGMYVLAKKRMVGILGMR